jgi:TolB-like protein/cytochrome c-type biogenesis protein CcmH/NrfG
MPELQQLAQSKERKLESWGEIAAYLRREIRTVQRWEKTLGLPIRRLQVGKQSSVYAFPSELDKWYLEREPQVKEEERSDEHTPTAPPELRPAFPIQAIDEKASQEIPFYKKKSTWFGGMAFLIILVLLIARSVPWPPSGMFPSRTTIPPDGKIRLFVRPFQNISGDPGQSEFTEGLTNELNTRLGRLDPKRLGVIAPTSSRQLGSKSISELETLFKLNYILEGSVRRASEKVRIDISLISVKDQTPLWSDSYTENLSDILKVQDEVAEAVAQKLLINLPAAAGANSAASVDPDGYNSYLRGRRFWAVRDLSRSVPAFEDAVRKLPQYVPARSGLATSYAVMGQAPNDAVPPSVSAPKGKAEALRALAMDPGNAEAHYVLGNIAMYYEWDFPAAESQLREAIRLDPNDPTAHQWLGQYFMMQNRPEEAQSETLKALELDPVSPIFTTARAETFYYAHDFDSAIAQAKLTLEQSPNFLLAHLWLASAYREKKMYPEAIQHFRTMCNFVPNNPALLMTLGHALAVSGDRQGALGILAQLQTLSHQRYVPALYIAGIYLGLRDFNNAFLYLDRAVTEHDDRLSYMAVEPMADPLRSDPRFQTVLTRIHLNGQRH